MSGKPDIFAILGLPRTATKKQVESAYRKKMKELHPDFGTDPADRRRRTREAAQLNAAKDRWEADPRPASSDSSWTGSGAGEPPSPPRPRPSSPRAAAPPPGTVPRAGRGRPSVFVGAIGVWVVVTVIFLLAAIVRVVFGGPAPNDPSLPAAVVPHAAWAIVSLAA